MLPVPVRMDYSKKFLPGGRTSTSDNDTIVNIMTTGKINDYALNNDKAKQQLLSSALRKRIESTKQTKKSTKFSMCTGTYKEVIFPLLNEWSNHDLTRGGVQIGSSPRMEAQLMSVRHDTESTAKNTQAVVDLCYKGKKVKLHLYHTNQSGLIQGENHEEFFKFFSETISELTNQNADRVKWFNRLVMSTFKPGPPRAGASRAGVRRPPSQPASSSTVHPAGSSASTYQAIRIADSQLELSGIPNCSQDISLDSIGAPALALDQLAEPTLEEAVCQAAAGMEGRSTSTPNLSPVSSPARRQATTQKTTTAPVPLASSLSGPVPLCSPAAQYIQKVQPVPKTPKNLTASQRIIFPLAGSPLPSEYDGDSEADEDLWGDASSSDQLAEALQLQLMAGPPDPLQYRAGQPEAVTELLSSLLEEAVAGAATTDTSVARATAARPPLEPIQLPAIRPVEAPTLEDLEAEFGLLKSLRQWSTSVGPIPPTAGHPGVLPAGSEPPALPPTGALPHSPASPLDESLSRQLPNFTQLPGPAFASVGDYMQFICASVGAQSEMILRLEDVGRRQNKLIHQLEDKVEVMSLRFQPVGSIAESPQPLSTSSASISKAAAPPVSQPVDLPSPPSNPPTSCLYPTLPPRAAETSRPTYADRARSTALPASSASRSRRKIAMITDSIAGKVHTEYLEKITKSKITKAKAYGAVHKPKSEGYKFPEKNFTAVVPAVLSSNDHSAAVLLAPSVHLTNLPTHTSDEQASEQAREAAHQMMAVAAEAVVSHPNLEKLVILEAAARFDQWSEINQHGNEELHVALEAIKIKRSKIKSSLENTTGILIVSLGSACPATAIQPGGISTESI